VFSDAVKKLQSTEDEVGNALLQMPNTSPNSFALDFVIEINGENIIHFSSHPLFYPILLFARGLGF
jgi:hypothetical protein